MIDFILLAYLTFNDADIFSFSELTFTTYENKDKL